MGESAAEPQNSNPSGEPERANGRFVKGKSGNPGGRPKGIAKAIRDSLNEAAGADRDGAKILVNFWAGLMADPKVDNSVRLRASENLANRGWGKPPTFVPVEDDDPLEVSEREVTEIALDFDRSMDELSERRARGR